jgi:hypothetical protein
MRKNKQKIRVYVYLTKSEVETLTNNHKYTLSNRVQDALKGRLLHGEKKDCTKIKRD